MKFSIFAKRKTKTPLLSHWFLLVKSLSMPQYIPLPRVSEDYFQGISQAVVSFRVLTWEESRPKLSQVVGRIQFLMVVRLRVPDFCWLSSGSCRELVKATHSPLVCGPLYKPFTTRLLAPSRPAGKQESESESKMARPMR